MNGDNFRVIFDVAAKRLVALGAPEISGLVRSFVSKDQPPDGT
jgi:hypothetical protein